MEKEARKRKEIQAMELSLLLTKPDPAYGDVRMAFDAVDFGHPYAIKFSSTDPQFMIDRKDPNALSGIRNTKIIMNIEGGGVLVLMGNLGCHFGTPWGGEFYLRRAVKETTDFNSIKAESGTVTFVHDNPSSIQECESVYKELQNSRDFVFNVSQFSEFMRIFEYYKQLSSELNNNFSFKIAKTGDPYYFIPVSAKAFDSEGVEQIYDADDILIGYAIDEAS